VLFSEDGEPVTVDLRGFLRISVSFITNLTGVCKEDCVNPLEWKRRMEGKEDEI
jgi:hypothetical protein